MELVLVLVVVCVWCACVHGIIWHWGHYWSLQVWKIQWFREFLLWNTIFESGEKLHLDECFFHMIIKYERGQVTYSPICELVGTRLYNLWILSLNHFNERTHITSQSHMHTHIAHRTPYTTHQPLKNMHWNFDDCACAYIKL